VRVLVTDGRLLEQEFPEHVKCQWLQWYDILNPDVGCTGKNHINHLSVLLELKVKPTSETYDLFSATGTKSNGQSKLNLLLRAKCEMSFSSHSFVLSEQRSNLHLCHQHKGPKNQFQKLW